MRIDRGKIVKYMLVFLAIMLFFTIISSKVNYIMTPEISAVAPVKAELSYALTASGQIEDGKVVFWLNMEKESYVGLKDSPSAEFSNIKGKLKITVEEKLFDADSQTIKYICALDNSSGSAVYEGQNCTVSFSYPLGSYELVFPRECVVRSGGGAYVFRVYTINSIMGNSTMVRRVDVTILAEDDYNVAVSGGVYSYETFAQYYSKPLRDGQKVRVSK